LKPVWVYVAVSPNKPVRIGASTDPRARLLSIGCLKLQASFPIVRSAADDIIAEARKLLGDGVVEPAEAVARVRQAIDRVSRYRHVDPALTAEQAKALRKQLLVPS
jgi:hypothetical protein